jgi:pimeloyl-ACP methyl ester carboxylesterase
MLPLWTQSALCGLLCSTRPVPSPSRHHHGQSRIRSPVAEAIDYYEHDGWRLAFRHKPAAPGREADPPLLLVHPVGIGLSGWFWDRFIDAWQGGELFAPDLIGCGESDAWRPEERGLFLPLDWARGCAALWRTRIQRPCVVIAQGGLAPVGVLLAARESDDWSGTRSVSHLVLTAPPTWTDITTAVPEPELRRNYNGLRSALGRAAIELIESRAAIRFFSDLFLFEGKCDGAWLDHASSGCSAAVREPVYAFNAGLLQHRSYENELTELQQPTLVLAGRADTRRERRAGYAGRMRSCELRTLPGSNVMPWEAPRETCDAVAEFARRARAGTLYKL